MLIGARLSKQRPSALAATVAGLCLCALFDGAARASAGSAAYPPGIHLRPDQPHPAVARVIVPEGDMTSFGSGTLVDVRDQFGLVITNWHVVRDGHGDVEVVFPDGFRSKARPLKVDADWDLAALVIWRPPATPVPIAARAPQSGDQLTICGYGQGQYRAATGRCTQYYSPKIDLPQHMVELDVEARQGDSGGPIFNDRGELAGVLFGAGGGTTLGSFGGRVESFLATLAPDIGGAAESAIVEANAGKEDLAQHQGFPSAVPSGTTTASTEFAAFEPPAVLRTPETPRRAVVDTAAWHATGPSEQPRAIQSAAPVQVLWYSHAKSVLAAIGAVALMMQVLRAVR